MRDRLEDLDLLIQHFLSRIAMRRSLQNLAITETAMAKLRSHPWTGNVRELQNILERAAVLSGGRIILPEHLLFDCSHQQQLPLICHFPDIINKISEG